MRYLAFLALIPLAACASPVATTDIQAQCPPIVNYDQKYQNEYALELKDADASGNYPVLIRTLGDYAVLRSAVRACINTKANH